MVSPSTLLSARQPSPARAAWCRASTQGAIDMRMKAIEEVRGGIWRLGFQMPAVAPAASPYALLCLHPALECAIRLLSIASPPS